MKTRTLLLLALACGVAIMAAGAVFLVQLSRQADAAPPVPLGVATEVGDMRVVVEAAVEHDGVLDVTVTIGGVDDADGASGFRLIASGTPPCPRRPASTGVRGDDHRAAALHDPLRRRRCRAATRGCCSTSVATTAPGGCSVESRADRRMPPLRFPP